LQRRFFGNLIHIGIIEGGKRRFVRRACVDLELAKSRRGRTIRSRANGCERLRTVKGRV
jgi:hypothetical protein